MDNGRPFRVPQSGDRRAANNRPEQAQRPAEEPRHASEPSRTVPPSPRPHHAPQVEKPGKRYKLPLIILAAVVLLGLVGMFVWLKIQNTAVAIDGSKYQAVFFTNGQVYFGKLQPANSEYLKLTDIYYLQNQGEQAAADSSNPQQTADKQKDLQLIKLGDEIHGPEDAMVISKDQLLFYENLKADGKVAQSIAQFKNSH